MIWGGGGGGGGQGSGRRRQESRTCVRLPRMCAVLYTSIHHPRKIHDMQMLVVCTHICMRPVVDKFENKYLMCTYIQMYIYMYAHVQMLACTNKCT